MRSVCPVCKRWQAGSTCGTDVQQLLMRNNSCWSDTHFGACAKTPQSTMGVPAVAIQLDRLSGCDPNMQLMLPITLCKAMPQCSITFAPA